MISGRIRSGRCLAAILALAGALLSGVSWGAEPRGLLVGTFRCDVTPPAGEPLIWAKPLASVEQPLLAKGIVLDDAGDRYLLCTMDWCEICGDSHDFFRERLAAAAGTDASRVAIQCVHQHAAPYADTGAHELLDKAPEPPLHLSDGFLEEVAERMAGALKKACAEMQPFDRVGTGQSRVDRVASTRRLPREEEKTGTGEKTIRDKIIVRYSVGGKDPALAAAPEGPIDPMLKTVTLARGEKPLVRLHYYATHPQTFCCDGRASSDFVGLAREDLEGREAVFQMYFTGCAGDVTVGKYNDGSAAARAALKDRLLAGMEASILSTRYEEAGKISWKTAKLALPLRKDQSDAACRARLEDPKAESGSRVYSGAMVLAFRARASRPLDLSCLELGKALILHLPGEPMLEFQLFGQRLRPERLVAVAGYGDCGPGYICTDKAYEEGGYEPTATNVAPGSEALLKKAIEELLGPAEGDREAVQPPFDKKRRDHILESMQLVMGSLPEKWRDLPLDLRVLEETRLDAYTRKKVTYRAEPEDLVTAYLLVPHGLRGKTPAVLCLHQTTEIGKDEPVGLGGNKDLRYAAELAERGYVTLAPDYWTFGDYRSKKYDPYEHGYSSGTMKGIWNHIRSVDLLSSLPEVDADRIGAVGHSLGGHNTLWLGAFDARVKVMVSSCGFNTFAAYAASKYGGGDLKNWAQRRYMPRVSSVYANDPKKMPFEWTEALAALAPRPVFVNAPLKDENFVISGVKDCIAAALPVYELLGAREKLVVVSPDTDHSFPPDIRRQAYEFLDRNLKR